jgi:hypothetical protein
VPPDGAWSQVSGPGSARFTPGGTTASDSSTVSLSAAGTYVLRVTVRDARGGTTTSDVTLVVNPGDSGADPRADCNGDGAVNALDLQIVVSSFGRSVQ